MSDNNNGSLLDAIILYTFLMYLLYIVILAIPIIPYFDVVLNIVFANYKPNSLFGKIITGALLFGIGFFMLEFVKKTCDSFFYSIQAKYFFLYGQGLIFISFMGTSETTIFYLSKVFVGLISMGFNEPIENGKNYVLTFGLVSFLISIFIEGFTRPKRPVVKRINIKGKDTRLDDYILMQNKLQVIKNAEELLKKDKISTFEETIIKKAEEYKKIFNEDELQNITETIKKYKS